MLQSWPHHNAVIRLAKVALGTYVLFQYKASNIKVFEIFECHLPSTTVHFKVIAPGGLMHVLQNW